MSGIVFLPEEDENTLEPSVHEDKAENKKATVDDEGTDGDEPNPYGVYPEDKEQDAAVYEIDSTGQEFPLPPLCI